MTAGAWAAFLLAAAFGAVFQMRGVSARALARWAGEMAPVSTMASRTSFDRASAASVASAGL